MKFKKKKKTCFTPTLQSDEGIGNLVLGCMSRSSQSSSSIGRTLKCSSEKKCKNSQIVQNPSFFFITDPCCCVWPLLRDLQIVCTSQKLQCSPLVIIERPPSKAHIERVTYSCCSCCHPTKLPLGKKQSACKQNTLERNLKEKMNNDTICQWNYLFIMKVLQTNEKITCAPTYSLMIILQSYP